jgi:hypothetical protein
MLSIGYEVTAIDSSPGPTALVDGFQFVRGNLKDFPCNVAQSRFLHKEPGREMTKKKALDTPVDIRRYALGAMAFERAVWP